MPQILKEESRTKILECARKEFVNYGYENASMRRIAFNSGMTVGNLYRYFKNKDDLVNHITASTLQLLNQLLEKETEDQISIDAQASNSALSRVNVTAIVEDFANQMVDIYVAHRLEMMVLMTNNAVSNSICEWFANLLSCWIDNPDEEYKRIMSHSMAISIVQGVQYCFNSFKDKVLNEQNIALLKELIVNYFDVFKYIARKKEEKENGLH